MRGCEFGEVALQLCNRRCVERTLLHLCTVGCELLSVSVDECFRCSECRLKLSYACILLRGCSSKLGRSSVGSCQLSFESSAELFRGCSSFTSCSLRVLCLLLSHSNALL